MCEAFGLTVSEAKIEIMYLRTKGMPESTTIFSVETAGQVYNQTNEFVYLGGTSTTVPTYPLRSTCGRIITIKKVCVRGSLRVSNKNPLYD